MISVRKKWVDKNFKIKIQKTGWIELINSFIRKNNGEVLPYTKFSTRVWNENCSFKKLSLAKVLKQRNTYAGKWFRSNQKWTDLYFSNEYLYLLFFDYFSTSRHTYPVVGVYEKGNTVVDIGGSIFGAYNLLKYGVKKVLITNFNNSPQIKFAKFVIKKFNLNIEIVANNKIPKNSILLCSEYFEHFKDVNIEVDRLLKFKPKKIYVKNSFCWPSYGHYIPIKINHNKYENPKLAQVAFNSLMLKNKYLLTEVKRFFGKIYLYEK